MSYIAETLCEIVIRTVFVLETIKKQSTKKLCLKEQTEIFRNSISLTIDQCCSQCIYFGSSICSVIQYSWAEFYQEPNNKIKLKSSVTVYPYPLVNVQIMAQVYFLWFKHSFFNYFLGKPCINVHFNHFFHFCLHIKQYLFPAWNVSWILIKKLLTIICLSFELLKCKDNWVLNN